jgi:hypothetical protein
MARATAALVMALQVSICPGLQILVSYHVLSVMTHSQTSDTVVSDSISYYHYASTVLFVELFTGVTS